MTQILSRRQQDAQDEEPQMVLHLLAGTRRKMLRYLIRRQGHRGHSKPTTTDETGRLTHDIDGRALGAKYVVGRRTLGVADEAVSPAELDQIAAGLFGSQPERVAPGALDRGVVGTFSHLQREDGPLQPDASGCVDGARC